MDINKLLISGRVGNKKLAFTPTGTAVLEFSVANNNRVKQGGEYVDQTIWFNVKVFGKDAESGDKFLDAKDAVTVQGRLQIRTYQKQDGTTGISTEILVRNFFDDVSVVRHAANARNSANATNAAPAPAPSVTAPPSEQSPDDGDIPF